jgi:hypothetical protein
LLKPARSAFSLSIAGVSVSCSVAAWTFKGSGLLAECNRGVRLQASYAVLHFKVA